MGEPLIMPIEIRPGYFVHIARVPFDLTEAEAAKIAAVIMAMATPSALRKKAGEEREDG